MNQPTSKRCPDCGIDKHRDDYYACDKGSGKLYTYCKDCSRVRAKAAYARADKADRARLHRQWLQENKDHVRAYRTANKIGVSIDQVKALLERGRCDICGSTESLCVDHCHAGGHLRGLLCNACNKGLGHFRDDPDLLRKASEYIYSDRIKSEIFWETYEDVDD